MPTNFFLIISFPFRKFLGFSRVLSDFQIHLSAFLANSVDRSVGSESFLEKEIKKWEKKKIFFFKNVFLRILLRFFFVTNFWLKKKKNCSSTLDRFLYKIISYVRIIFFLAFSFRVLELSWKRRKFKDRLRQISFVKLFERISDNF